MTELPLTLNEKNLLKQIDEEVATLGKEATDLLAEMDKETDHKKQEELLRRSLAKSKTIRDRCKIREGIFKAGMDRLSGRF